MVVISLTQQDAIDIVRLINKEITKLEVLLIENSETTNITKTRGLIMKYRKIRESIRRQFKNMSIILLEDIFNNTEDITI